MKSPGPTNGEADVDAAPDTTPVRWLNRNVVGLGINRFLSDFGHEAGTAILPLFLTMIGAPAMALGAIEGVADAVSAFAKLGGGWLGDRVRHRRRWAALGYLVTGVATGLYGAILAWPWILAVRTLGWAGRGLRSPLHDALLTDSVPAQARGRAFGLDEAADTAGAIAGPLAALAIVSLLDGGLGAYRVAFWLAAIPGVLAAATMMMLVRETEHPLLHGTSLWAAVGLMPARFRRYLLALFVFGCGDFSHTLLILYAVQSLTPDHPVHAGAIAIALYTLHNLLYAAGAYPVGVLADRFGKHGFLIAASCLAVVMNLLLVLGAPSLWLLVLVFGLAGAHYAAQQTLERAIAADLAPPEARSTAFGVLAAVNGVGDLVASLVVGALWTAISPTAAFGFSLAVTTAGTAVIALVLLGLSSADADR